MEGIIKKISKHTNRAKVQLNFMSELHLFSASLTLEVIYFTKH